MVTMAPLWNSMTPWIVVGVPTLILAPVSGTFGVVTVRSGFAMPVNAVTRLTGPISWMRSVT